VKNVNQVKIHPSIVFNDRIRGNIQTMCILYPLASPLELYNPTKNKTHECRKSGVTTCVFSFSSVYTVFFVINCHNTHEYMLFLLIKLDVNVLPYFWSGRSRKLIFTIHLVKFICFFVKFRTN